MEMERVLILGDERIERRGENNGQDAGAELASLPYEFGAVYICYIPKILGQHKKMKFC